MAIDPAKDPRTDVCPLCGGCGLVTPITVLLLDRLKLRCHDLKRRIDEASVQLDKIRKKRVDALDEVKRLAADADHILLWGMANYDGSDDPRIP